MHSTPASVLPNDTGSRFLSRKSAQLTLAPSAMPSGMKKQLAIEC